MRTLFPNTKILIAVLSFSLMAAVVLGIAEPALAAKKFTSKECLECHQKFADKYLGMKQVHRVVGEKKCEECHLRHGRVPVLLLKKDGNELCYGCHSKERIIPNKSHTHGVLKKGKCISCHDPHASDAVHLLKAEGSELCYRCHAREQYSKKTVHAVLPDKGCSPCHAAHASFEPSLLTKPQVTLCLSCHDSSSAAFKKSHGDYPVQIKVCTGCHNPHSSMQPKLMKSAAHSPVAAVSCTACHNSATSPKPFGTAQEGGALCMQCHAKTGLMKGDVEHPPLRKAIASRATTRMLLRTKNCWSGPATACVRHAIQQRTKRN